MLVKNKTVKMNWHPGNKKYYIEKGYLFTKMGDSFDVKVEDLPDNSHVYVDVECDFCGRIIKVKFQNYHYRGKLSDGYACKKCVHLKARNSVINKYGVENIFQDELTKEKIKKSNMEKYGVKYYSQTESCKEKIKKHSFEKYGVANYLQTEESKEKARNTSLEKYGKPYYIQTEEGKHRIKETLYKKYGGIGMGSPETSVKIIKSMYDNGNVPCSKPQYKLYKTLKKLFGCAYLNYSFKRYSFDILVDVSGVKIDFEYDGKYWHSSSKVLDRDSLRDKSAIENGFKVCRIISNIEILSDKYIIEAVKFLLKKENNKIVFDLTQKEKI